MKGSVLSENPDSRALITRLILQNRAIIFGYILTQTGDHNNAEDIFQDVCLTICRKFSEFEKGTNFKAWAMKITRYKILSYYQSNSRKTRAKVRLTPEIAGIMADPDVWLQEMESFAVERAALRCCLEEMTEKGRAMILDRYGKGLPVQGMAKSRGWTPNSVSVALCRLKEALEKCVQRFPGVLGVGRESEKRDQKSCQVTHGTSSKLLLPSISLLQGGS